MKYGCLQRCWKNPRKHLSASVLVRINIDLFQQGDKHFSQCGYTRQLNRQRQSGRRSFDRRFSAFSVEKPFLRDFETPSIARSRIARDATGSVLVLCVCR